jgi:hypothetical protein
VCLAIVVPAQTLKIILQTRRFAQRSARLRRHLSQSLVMTDIAQLRAQIAAGTYRVDADSIASALLDFANVADASPPPARDQASALLEQPVARRQPQQHS